jgi:alkanesulfonate monooxygenase SsuD/methylene tetrahydromethanopterin reductase-like flavin-dependent oxidoreductase (luciferase family)
MSKFARVYQHTAGSYDFWIDNGLAIVGSPETVTRRIQVQQDLIGHDVFCAQHQIADMSRDLVHQSLKLFGEGVIPALRP